MNNISAWELHTRQALAPILYGDRNLMAEIVFRYGFSTDDCYLGENSHYGKLLTALMQLYANPKLALTPEVVYAQNNALPLEWLLDLRKYHTGITSDAISSALIAQKEARRYWKTTTVARTLQELQSGKGDAEDILNRMIIDVSQQTAKKTKPSLAVDILKEIEEENASGEAQIVTGTGLTWCDDILDGGLWSSELVAIAGGEKERKTSFLRNLLLGALRTGEGITWTVNENVHVCFMGFENDRKITVSDFIAMLMFEYIHFHHYDNITYGKVQPTPLSDLCKAKTFRRAYASGKWKHWPQQLQDAMHYALRLFRQMSISFYDSRKDSGNLRSLGDMIRVIRLDDYLYGKPNQHRIYCADYAQLVIDTGQIFDDMRKFASEALNVATDMNATFIALSQNNRAFKKERASGTDGGVLGTKGGADLEQAVHSYIEMQYDMDNPTVLKATMRRSRRGESGLKRYREFEIHPPSGLVLAELNT